MRPDTSLKRGLKAVVLILALFVLAGYAAQKTDSGQSPDRTVTLNYQFPEGKTFAYQQISNETQNIDLMGQSMTTQAQSTLEFSAKQKSIKDDNFTLTVTIDGYKADSQTPQGNMSADASGALGKSFDMILSKLGKEIDATGAAAIHYESGAAGTRDFGATFQAFFPDLPGKAVKTGDTWPSEDTVSEKVGDGEVRVVSKNDNTLDGFETVDGFECARIKTTIKGTMTGGMSQGNIGLSFDCKIEGTATWYFAIKEGILVKSETKTTLGGTMALGDPVNQSVPMTGDSHDETHLIKK